MDYHEITFGGIMNKNLSDMSLEELWELFPIVIEEHNPQYKDWYEIEKYNLLTCVNPDNVCRINHIGSSAVEGLLAKPTVDILLEVSNDCNISQLINILQNNEWILMSNEYEPDLKLAFNKGYTPDGFAEKVYHLHVRYSGDWNELYFRDYLIAYPDIVSEYGKLKLDLCKKNEHNRDGYTEAKSAFIIKYTVKAKSEYKGRYTPSTGVISPHIIY